MKNIIMLDIMFYRETPSLHHDTTGDLEEISCRLLKKFQRK